MSALIAYAALMTIACVIHVATIDRLNSNVNEMVATNTTSAEIE
jgi:hypothetical protein